MQIRAFEHVYAMQTDFGYRRVILGATTGHMVFKVGVHQIPITPAERSFVSALLSRAIEQGNRDVVGAANVIAVTPARPDGLINVVLSETDRNAVFDVVGWKLPELRMKPGDLKRFTPPKTPEAIAHNGTAKIPTSR